MIKSKHFFSLDQFSHPQSLTLIDIKEQNMEKLKLMLPIISELICFSLINPDIASNFKTTNIISTNTKFCFQFYL